MGLFIGDAVARSHVTATIDFDDVVDAAAVAATLRANGIVDEYQVAAGGVLTELGSVTVAGATGGEGILAF